MGWTILPIVKKISVNEFAVLEHACDSHGILVGAELGEVALAIRVEVAVSFTAFVFEPMLGIFELEILVM